MLVVENPVVDLVGHQQQAVLLRDRHDPLQQRARIVGAGRVVGVDQHDRARARGHQRFDLVRIGEEPILRAAAVVHRSAVVEDGGRRPQRIVGRGQQHLVARIEQRAQRDVDQLAHAIAHEHALGRGVGRAARLVERGDRFARLGQALLVGIGIGAGDVVGDRALQVLGRAEAERAGVADVELDQAAALGLQLARAPRQLAADLVADFGQAGAGLEAGRGHRAGVRRKKSRQPSGKPAPASAAAAVKSRAERRKTATE